MQRQRLRGSSRTRNSVSKLEAAYQQTNGTITALYDSAPSVEGEGTEITNQNRQVVE